MIKVLKYVTIFAAMAAGSAAFAQSAPGWGQDGRYWPGYREGYENLNNCQYGFHAVPFPNGNGFRCVQNGW